MNPVDKAISEGINQKTLSAKETEELFFWSFYFSQGKGTRQDTTKMSQDGNVATIRVPENGYQAQIFRYVAAKHPEWNLAKGARFAATHAVKNRVTQMIKRGVHFYTRLESVENALEDEFDSFLKIMDSPGRRTADLREIQTELLRWILERDSNYTFAGRPGAKRSEAKGFLDPQMSHFITYVINRDSIPGPRVYTEMMADLRDALSIPEVVARLNVDELAMVLTRNTAPEKLQQILKEFPLLGSLIGSSE